MQFLIFFNRKWKLCIESSFLPRKLFFFSLKTKSSTAFPGRASKPQALSVRLCVMQGALPMPPLPSAVCLGSHPPACLLPSPAHLQAPSGFFFPILVGSLSQIKL